ncbi:MAG: Holliday junction resolvase RuvX [Ilumatobacteraceae bacterium]
MRALGVDLGSKRIGIAVSDRSGTIASPLVVLQRSGSLARDHHQIAKLAAEEEAECLVIGLPMNMDGSLGPAAKAAMKEAEALSTVVGVPIHFSDERRSTVTADRVMIERGMDAKARRKVVDKVAAAVLLQHWLDGRAAQGGVPS